MKSPTKPLAALGFLVFATTSATAELLLYEPFDYGDDWLNGKGGALGTTGTWSSNDTGVGDGWRAHPAGLSGVAVNAGYDPLNPDAPGILNRFDGSVANLITSGGYAGMAGPEDRGLDFGTDGGTGNLDANIGIDPSVTATFVSGTTTWFSFVGAHAWDRNQGSPSLTIGTDPTVNGSRGLTMLNSGSGISAVGGPPRFNLFDVYPHYFEGGLHHQTPGGYQGGVLGDHNGIVPSFASGTTSDGVLGNDDVMPWAVSDASGEFGAPNIIVGKIEWDADVGGYDIVTVVSFQEDEAITEAAFNALVAAKPTLSSANWPAAVTPADPSNPSNKPNLDQSQFDTLNISSLKFFVDEIRIATTFEEAIGLEPPPVETFALTIAPAVAPDTGYVLEWESQGGKLYNVLTSTDLSVPISGWDLVEGDIQAEPPFNTKAVDPADPRRFYAVEEFDAPPVTVFSEGFDGVTAGTLPNGWTTGRNDPPDAAGTTEWEVGTPANVGPVPPGVPLPSGAQCVATGISANYEDPPADNYSPYTDIWLRSAPIDLTGQTAGTLVFQQWTEIESVAGDFDYGSIRILDAADDSELAVLEARTIDGTTTGWEEYSKALPAEAFGSSTGSIRIEFRFEADDFTSYAGWYIDDVTVTVPAS